MGQVPCQPGAGFISCTLHSGFHEARDVPPITDGETEAQGRAATQPSLSTEPGSRLFPLHPATSLIPEATVRGTKGRQVEKFPPSVLGSGL